MKEKVYEAIKLQNGKLTFNNLKKKFMINDASLNSILLELKLDGKIIQSSNKYSLFPNDNYIGEISLTQSGKKVIFFNGERIVLASDFFDKVILSDVVSFKINEHGEAVITSIIDRRLGNITCEVVNDNGKKRIVPYHDGINIVLPKDIMKELLDGDIILVNISSVNEDGYSDAKFIKKICDKYEPNKEEITIAINYGFDNDYSDEYLEELKKIPKEVSDLEMVDRTDYRDMKFFTIDGKNTKDMDDAVGAIRLDNGNILVYVSIADVSHYIKFDSVIYERALEKTTSLYLNNNVFHMFHKLISNGICSLNPLEDRLTKTVAMEIDRNGNIINYEVVRSVINSKIKMNYDDVDTVLQGGEIPLGYENYVEDLKLLNEAAVWIEDKLIRDGKIEFANTELDIVYDENGEIVSSQVLDRSPGRKLIEHLMIAANSTIANYLFYLGVPSIFRVHDLPNVEKINKTIDLINKNIMIYNNELEQKHNENGEVIHRKRRMKFLEDASKPSEIQALLNMVDEENYQVVSMMLLQCMQRARYSTDNTGHYALALDFYTHFTSPIRRIVDFENHALLDLILKNYDKISEIDYNEMRNYLEDVARKASKMERCADAAERASENLTILKDMQKYIGEEYDGVILEVDNRIKIRINNIDGYINIQSLGSNFNYDKRRKLYYDIENGKALRPGTKVKTVLNSVNLSNRTFNVSLISVVDSKKMVKDK